MLIEQFRRGTVRVAGAIALVLAVGAVALPGPAAAAAGAHITGRVGDADGVALANITVSLYHYEADDYEWVEVTSTATNVTGQYDLEGLAPGTYRVGFEDPAGSHVPEYWDDALDIYDGQDLVLAGSEVVADVDASLAPAGHITGTVTGPSSEPLEHVNASVYQYEHGDWWFVEGGLTDPAGHYDVSGLPGGTYRLGFTDGMAGGPYATEYWDNKLDIEAATDIVVPPGAVVANKNAQLAPAAHIQGLVTGPDGAPVPMEVTAYRFNPVLNEWDDVEFASNMIISPGSDESYSIDGLPAGTYRLQFRAFRCISTGSGLECTSDPAIALEYWDDQADIESALDITVASGETAVGKNAQLGVGGSISGHLSDGTGAPVVGSVSAYRKTASGAWVYYAYGYSTDGTYTVGQLRAGTYRLKFNPEDVQPLAPEYYDNASSLLGATDIIVGTGAAVTGKDAVLTPDGPGPTVTNTSPPTVLGTPQVGGSLAATPGGWSPGDVSTAYQWLAGGAPINGATGATYSPVTADVGKAISVRVTASKAGYASGTATSAATAAVAAPAAAAPPASPSPGAIALAKLPAISGTPMVGKKLSVSAGLWNPGGVQLSYQWYAGGKAIKGATGSSFKVGRAQVGDKMTVKVTAAASGYTPVTVTTKPSQKVKAKPKKPKRVALRPPVVVGVAHARWRGTAS